MIYLDNAATTRLSHAVFEEMRPWLGAEYGNPGALYGLGRRAKAAVDLARERTAVLFGCSAEQVIFTSGGSEGNNLVVKGLIPYLAANGRRGLVTTAVEHDSVLRAVDDACRIKPEFYKRFLHPTADGTVSQKHVSQVVHSKTGLVSVMYVNNEMGACNDVISIGSIAHNSGALFHSDCVQAAGCFRLDEIRPYCDFMTVSSHKIHGPKGVGAVYAADPSILTPLISGGAFQEHGLRGGTENVAGIVGFGKACELAVHGLDLRALRLTHLKTHFCNCLMAVLSDIGLSQHVRVNGALPTMRGKVLSLRFDGVDAQTMLLALDAAGVCCSAGSACTSRENEPSHVLKAMGLSDNEARSTLRFSFDEELTEQELANAAKIVASVYHLIRIGAL